MATQLDTLITEGLEEIFPSAVLLASIKGKPLIHQAYGKANLHTLFDLASLTKAFSTALLTACFFDAGLLQASDTISRFAPHSSRQAWHDEVTIEMLLNHRSGLPAWKPYYLNFSPEEAGSKETKQKLLGLCWEEKLLHKPRTQTVYSDIDHLLLGSILETVASSSLQHLFAEYIAKKLSLSSLQFSPVEANLAAPSGFCTWRQAPLQGQAHDYHAYLFGGTAGNAGLFGTAEDCAKIAAAFFLLDDGEDHFITSKTWKDFFSFPAKKQTQDSFTGGWNMPSAQDSSSGKYFSARSLGHLGFTGCSLWIDLQKRSFVIFLCNRLEKENSQEKMKAFRPRLHDLLFADL
ncbi:MAG: hypothetical protein COX62_05955 [Deltaproteobacteria bacterium CG_4_10_14_0_2_um_filter_43_8]|nr:MAG: hypothetical protein COV43_04895 [Deltaproteobacteria bacterium CG11_big_fil_rev_8_21_14_0_20_42_23]PJA19804.1 MAG: hypothetical protein COX62_05955 [Deltaproteobacteria bacterium CG_4_10_14_0_2_um_filter_43_8]PJC65112.1 MAG: hypothetical protein CO021_01285 [Deltaproteobacteria bacterium CG_4_9_14_0_2_um_filter_42_21]